MTSTATLTSFEFTNETGVLAAVGAALDGEDVDVLGFAICSREAGKTVHLVTEQTSPSLAMLDEEGLSRCSREVLVVPVGGDPRELGEVGRRLAEADVPVEASIRLKPSGPEQRIGIVVDDLERARDAIEAGGRLQRAV